MASATPKIAKPAMTAAMPSKKRPPIHPATLRAVERGGWEVVSLADGSVIEVSGLGSDMSAFAAVPDYKKQTIFPRPMCGGSALV
jgi:hypothetical protein